MNRQSISVFKMMGHPVRVHIIKFIRRRGQSHIKELFDELGYQEARSWYHLNSLRQAGVVHARRVDGRELLLTLNIDVISKALFDIQTDLSLKVAGNGQ